MECSDCKTVKLKEDYYWNKKKGIRVSSKCKACYMLYQKGKRTEEDKKKHAEYMKNYTYRENPDKKLICNKVCTCCKENKEIVSFFWDCQKKSYMSHCKTCIYASRKRSKTPKDRISKNLRTRVRNAVVYQNTYKSKRTMELLDCDIKMFCIWLESQFDDSMTFDNYGSVWHIDHCIPCASFNLLEEDEQMKCFHWSNLRPEFKIENIRKSSKIDNKLIASQKIRAEQFRQRYNLT